MSLANCQPSATQRSFAEALDAADPLAHFKEQFLITDPDLCYLDGNSLGRLPKKTIEAVNHFLTDEWGHELVDGWGHWIDQAQLAGDLLARSALGTGSGQTLVCDTTSVNFYQLCVAAVKARPGRKTIIIDAANFPTDRYIVAGIAEQFGLNLVTLNNDGLGGPGQVEVQSELELISPQELRRHLSEDVAFVTLQAIHYRSGARPDIKGITDVAREFGALVIWDCSHAAGAIDLEFDKNGVDLAVGCTYKYGNSGPGSPAWLFVRKELQSQLQVPIQGWFSNEKQFEMGPFFEKAKGIRGFQIASPSIIGIRGVEVAFAMIEQAGIKNIEAKAAKGTDLMIELFDHWLAPLGFTLGTPRDAKRRGGHIIVIHKDAKQIALALRKLKNVIPDYREPGAIRLAISPLTTSYTEVFDGFLRLKEMVESGDYKQIQIDGNRVT
jgi:kynureninase